MDNSFKKDEVNIFSSERARQGSNPDRRGCMPATLPLRYERISRPINFQVVPCLCGKPINYWDLIVGFLLEEGINWLMSPIFILIVPI